MNKPDESDVYGLLEASKRPSLDEVDEIRYSKNTPANELTDSDSDSSLSDYNCGEFGSLISKKITYDIYKSYAQSNPVYLLESNDNISLYSKAQKSNRVDSKKKQNSDSKSAVSSVIHRISTGVQYDVPSDNRIHYSRSNSMCYRKQKKVSNKSTAQSHTGLPSVITEKKECAEKMTYCRPVYNNCYNEEFVFKTVEKNRRLKKLVEKLASAREREKQEDAWNNYINELKNKHKFNAGPSSIPMPPRFDNRTQDELIENFYKTRFHSEQSNVCRNMLKDFYEPCTATQNTSSYEYMNFDYCAPASPRVPSSNMLLKRNANEEYTSFPGNKLFFNRDMTHQGSNHYCSRPVGRNVYSNTIFLEEEYGPSGKRANKSTAVYKKRTPRVLKTSSIQTNLKLLPLKEKLQEAQKVTDKYNKISNNIHKIKEGIDSVRAEHRHDSLESIESKLDVLIRSVNTLVAEIRERGVSRNSSSANNNIITVSRSVDAVGVPVTQYLIDLTNSVPKVISSRMENLVGCSKMNNIMVEEMDKSNELKRDIENILNGDANKCYAIQMTDHIPTKDHCTAVTPSTSKSGTKEDVVEERRDLNDGRMAIAVNTDPLGLLGLLRISRDAVKNILSYMPSIPYQSLMPIMQPVQQQRENMSFVCSICAAAFTKPSELTEHMHSHIRNRDCCVCRHLTGALAQNPRRIFFCEYCGKPFSRAYCCELHQQTCAKRLGKLRDVTSSLVLLR